MCVAFMPLIFSSLDLGAFALGLKQTLARASSTMP
jgi:hypothetical protein